MFNIKEIQFENPFLNASGCWSSNKPKILELLESNLGGVITKSCSLKPSLGNIKPNYYFDEKTKNHFNSKGLPNLGYDYFKNLNLHKMTPRETLFENSNEINQERIRIFKPFILSIAFTSLNDLFFILTDYDKNINNNKRLVEINLSCPNVDSRITGYHKKDILDILSTIKNLNLKNIIIGLKMPPYFELEFINKLTNILNNFKDILGYIVLSNTIPNGLILDENNKPILSNIYGGISGNFNKFISISNICSFRTKYKLDKEIKIMGCGGIETLEDVDQYLEVGADFIQLGSCFYNNDTNQLDIEKINKLINSFLIQNTKQNTKKMNIISKL
jgi:dihydroorotate dehydrogenase (fumarate)